MYVNEIGIGYDMTPAREGNDMRRQRKKEMETTGTRVERTTYRGTETRKNWNKVRTRVQGCKKGMSYVKRTRPCVYNITVLSRSKAHVITCEKAVLCEITTPFMFTHKHMRL